MSTTAMINDGKSLFSVFDDPAYKTLSYFDSAATCLVPSVVAKARYDYDGFAHANSHRGFYQLSANATDLVEQVRAKVARFIHATSANDIIFTSNTTHAINLVADSYVRPILKPSHNVVVSVAEHHANFLPWQQLCQSSGAELRVARLESDGQIDKEHLSSLVDEHTVLIAMSHMSNVIGQKNSVRDIAQIAKKFQTKLLVDGAQAVAHHRVDVQQLDCDFYVFSGHKCYAGGGAGVLYARAEIQDNMQPSVLGGGMVDSVTLDGFVSCQGPQKFEAGSRNTSALVGLSTAIDFLIGLGKQQVHDHVTQLASYLNFQLNELPFIVPVGQLSTQGIISFNVKGVHSHDVATWLDSDNIAIRAGHHCAQPLHQFLNISSSVRVSIGLNNEIADIDKLIQSLVKTYSIMRIN